MNRLQAIAPLREGKPWMTNVALSLLGSGLVLLARQFVIEHDHYVMGFSGVAGWSAMLYIAAVIVVLTQPVNRWTFAIVIGFSVICHGITFLAEPFLSSDMYRYVWDGVVQHAGINPYRYVPGDPALAFLRQPYQILFDNINRRDYAHTIYPPVAQMIYWLVTFFLPTVAGMKLAMLGFEAIATGAVVKLLGMMGKTRENVLLLLWCPLLVWEIGDAGHVDAAVLAFVSLALLCRYKNLRVWTGVFLGCAVLTKFYPLVLFPALWQRKDWKMPGVMVAMAVGTYAIYSSVGMGVFGFMSGYAKEEGIDSGARYFLLQAAQKVHGMAGLTTTAYMMFCGVVMAGLCWWCWTHATAEVCPRDLQASYHREGVPVEAPKFLVGAMMLGWAMMLLFSPHYPWYIVWLIPFFTLVPRVGLLAYLMMFFYMFTTALADGTVENMFRLNEILYGVVLAACVVGWAMRRWDAGQYFVSSERRHYGPLLKRPM